MPPALLVFVPASCSAQVLAAARDAAVGAGAAGVCVDYVGGDAASAPAADVNAWRMRLDVADDAARLPPIGSPDSRATPTLLLQLTSTAVHDTPSSPRTMPRAAAAVNAAARITGQLGARIALEPAPGCWMQRLEDACRLAMRVNRPDVGVAFSLDAWRAADGDAAHLPDRLRLAGPRLWAVSCSLPTVQGAALHRDLPRLGQLLNAIQYRGPVIVDAMVPRDAITDTARVKTIVAQAITIVRRLITA